MTEKDKELISRARKLSHYDWGEAFDLAKLAETEEARAVLRRIGSDLYHTEEFHCGLL